MPLVCCQITNRLTRLRRSPSVLELSMGNILVWPFTMAQRVLGRVPTKGRDHPHKETSGVTYPSPSQYVERRTW
jgi:hypothetical protein